VALYEKYRTRGLTIVGIDVQWDKESLARTFLEVYKVNYLAGRDATGDIGKLYGVEATPTSVFIDKAGKVVEQHEGELSQAEFTQRIDAMLK
jgi:thioredoxin-related protein